MTNQIVKKEPVIYPINQLPKFIQSLVSEMWHAHGIPPKDMEQRNLVFTYYDGIYSATPMHTDLFMHEATHFIRQGAGEDEMAAKDWWMRYCTDPEFRYEEELLAYREQYAYILKQVRGNKQTAFLHAKRLALDLSSPIYGNLRPFQTALGDITRKDDKKT